MSSHELIDAQFDRAVQIVQSLPKTGPIQTDYEEKLTMYSLYKQATVGNVKSPRPRIFDMLGRAKWDAWAKHKDLAPYEAKLLYVDALLKVLRKYSDKTIAMNLVQELESYGGDPSSLVMSRTLSKSSSSDSSGSTVSETDLPPYQHSHSQQQIAPRPEGEDSSSEEDSNDEAGELPSTVGPLSQNLRPQSSLSSRRYRTPMAGSLAMSPPPSQGIPSTQPLPGFETPSAFADHSPIPASIPPSAYPNMNAYTNQFTEPTRNENLTPGQIYPNYRNQMQSHPSLYGTGRPVSRPATLERAIENVQTHLAALTERLESLEARSNLPLRSMSLHSRSVGSSPWGTGQGSPNNGHGGPHWDIDDMGMWSIVLNPLSRGLDVLRDVAFFFARDENRSPTMIIVRRLCLDISFLACVVAFIGIVWRKSGVRRREVRAALHILWRAVLGTKSQRAMVDRGV